MREYILHELKQASDAAKSVSEDNGIIQSIIKVADVCVEALRNGNTLFFAGNGGSAADAQHFAAELVGRFYKERPGISAYALHTDTSMLTAISNDYGFEYIFSRQLDANGKKGDIFIALSTSGESENIIKALYKCSEIGITTVGLIGANSCRMKEQCQYTLEAPAVDTPRVQEAHTIIGHTLCAAIENQLYS